MKIPHPSTMRSKEKQVNYSSMQKEIQKIADPISFEGLKMFYNV